jgi:hypothetical protein
MTGAAEMIARGWRLNSLNCGCRESDDYNNIIEEEWFIYFIY